MIPDYVYKAKCTRVVDGDTADFLIDLGLSTFTQERLRVAYINAPETYGVKKESDEYKIGLKSSERLRELILDKDVVIKTLKDKKGKYGRYIAEIYIDGSNVGDMLVKEGLAKYQDY